MQYLTPADLIELHRFRYAVKRFDASRRISADAWNALEQTLLLSPSSFGLQPWRFLVVTNPELKARLKSVSWDQAQLVDASHVVAFAVLREISTDYVERYIASIAATRQQPLDSPGLQGLKNMILQFSPQRPNLEWNARQAYIALGNFMTSAAAMGIDTCPLEGIDPAQYDEILGLKESGYATVVACAAGYRAADDKYATLPKVRFADSELITRFD